LAETKQLVRNRPIAFSRTTGTGQTELKYRVIVEASRSPTPGHCGTLLYLTKADGGPRLFSLQTLDLFSRSRSFFYYLLSVLVHVIYTPESIE
jgi:hypothetical protein